MIMLNYRIANSHVIRKDISLIRIRLLFPHSILGHQITFKSNKLVIVVSLILTCECPLRECINGGLDYWTGTLDWTSGLTFDLKITRNGRKYPLMSSAKSLYYGMPQVATVIYV